LERGLKDEVRRRALADFLKTRRKGLKPTHACLSSGHKRLTPGLRREEVAELAGIGTTWYTWLEQARDVSPSEITLNSIARALRLSSVERRYLLDLALEHAPSARPDAMVTPTLLSIVNGMPCPATVLSPSWDIIAYNVAANALVDLDYAPFRNWLRLVFTPQLRVLIRNWPSIARQRVALFRAHNARRLGTPAVQLLVSDLTQQSPQFLEWWTKQEVSDEMNSGHIRYDHPFVGDLSFDFELLGVLENPNLLLYILVCSRDETRARLEELVGQQRRGEHTPDHNIWTARRHNGWAQRDR
jgi:transcriptional regulator with XRE-family HTH domain